MPESNTLEYAGQIDIQQSKLVSTTGIIVDLEDYLIEIDIFEDIYSNFLYGQIMLSDSRNIISLLPIVGEEYLIVKMTTPSIGVDISKTFRIYSVSDRKTVRDTNTQTYILHFCSFEAIVDSANPLFRPFEGKISDVIEKIFIDYLELPRTYNIDNGKLIESVESTPLYLLNEIQNKVKFISPGWTAAKCLNWLASKSIPEEGKASDFLFWETTQAFYFGNIEKIYKDAHKDEEIIKGVYEYSSPNTSEKDSSVEKMFIAEDFDVIRTSDNLVNYNSGYLANRLITLDLYNKKYDVTDFDYTNEYYSYEHTNKSPETIFARDTIRNPATHIKFYPVNRKLFTGVDENVNEKIIDVYGNRTSRMLELNNFIIQITVPGRTDLEVGSMIYFKYPNITEKFLTVEENGMDRNYSGLYLITAIRHKINLKKHMMIMELAKDSLDGSSENAGE